MIHAQFANGNKKMTSARSTRLPMVLLGLVMLVLVWSSVAPHDRLTWLLEVVPVLIAVPLLLLSARTFPLTALAYVLIALHAVILMYGGHYTYALTPLGDLDAGRIPFFPQPLRSYRAPDAGLRARHHCP